MNGWRGVEEASLSLGVGVEMFSPALQLTSPIRVGLDSSAGSWSLGDTVPPTGVNRT